MTTFDDLKRYFKDQKYKIIIAADGETRTHVKQGKSIVEKTSAGGVSVAFDALARASGGIYITRGRTPEDKQVVNREGKIVLGDADEEYTLKRLFLNVEDEKNYYTGYSNQTLWPLCHIAFERPAFNRQWWEGYIKVNKLFAKAIEEEIEGKTFIWINDYQLSLVPLFLNRPKDSIVGFFWHIPWPNWETFRILPNKRDILWSLLSCDFLAFHRGYQMRNFYEAVSNELEARISRETNIVYFDENILKVGALPMGIDTDTIRNLVEPEEDAFLLGVIRNALGINEEKKVKGKKQLMELFFDKYKVMLGVDRLDYTKGIRVRLQAIDMFFANNPQYRGKAIYIGIMAPTRTEISSYRALKKEIMNLVAEINKKYQTKDWKPLQMVYEGFTRNDVMDFYKKASICLVTPLDDGMNLVSKEFVIASSFSSNPGMLILSQFAGSASDLTSALIVNPYDIESVALAIKNGLEMEKDEKIERVKHMVDLLEERNVYEWARTFVKDTITAATENQHFLKS